VVAVRTAMSLEDYRYENDFCRHSLTGVSEDGQPRFHPMEMIAFRHYRTPFPVKILYALSQWGREDVAQNGAENPIASPGG
ncbi:MAG: hypothetical protein PPHEMADM_5602, partial [uncultured Paraburkholderia sp.]